MCGVKILGVLLVLGLVANFGCGFSISDFLRSLRGPRYVNSVVSMEWDAESSEEVEEQGDIWALLVAGSNTWMNYRHQADVCHAYQILHSHGIPDERIVVMMYDDLAYNSQNPTPGVVINHINGSNVYPGVLKDYTGSTVTPDNFLHVLTGNKAAVENVGSGRVLESGPNDHVFVYFADHGATGVLGFPSEDVLYANDLTKAILKMNKEQRYKKMVFYVEACESGSMFKKSLPNDINVFATTAANSVESSFACYMDEHRRTYLGDVYSVNWMEDSDSEILTRETLQSQYLIVKNETKTSHVQEYGDLSISQMDVSEFQGRKSALTQTVRTAEYKFEDAVPAYEVPVALLRKQLDKTTSEEEEGQIRQALTNIDKGRRFLSKVVGKLVLGVTGDDEKARKLLRDRHELTDFDCHELVARHFSKHCFDFVKNPYAMRHVYVLVNMCEDGYSVPDIKATIESTCTHRPMEGII